MRYTRCFDPLRDAKTYGVFGANTYRIFYSTLRYNNPPFEWSASGRYYICYAPIITRPVTLLTLALLLFGFSTLVGRLFRFLCLLNALSGISGYSIRVSRFGNNNWYSDSLFVIGNTFCLFVTFQNKNK